MNDPTVRSMAVRAIENAETAAQVEIKNEILLEALIDNIEAELNQIKKLADRKWR
jgi:hypothetical protein